MKTNKATKRGKHMSKISELFEKLKKVGELSEEKAEALAKDLEATLHKHWDEIEGIVKDAKLEDMVREALKAAGASSDMLKKDIGDITLKALKEHVESVGGKDKSTFIEFLSHPRFKEFMTEFANFNNLIRKKL